jgi:hypothetical protein
MVKRLLLIRVGGCRLVYWRFQRVWKKRKWCLLIPGNSKSDALHGHPFKCVYVSELQPSSLGLKDRVIECGDTDFSPDGQSLLIYVAGARHRNMEL